MTFICCVLAMCVGCVNVQDRIGPRPPAPGPQPRVNTPDQVAHQCVVAQASEYSAMCEGLATWIETEKPKEREVLARLKEDRKRAMSAAWNDFEELEQRMIGDETNKAEYDHVKHAEFLRKAAAGFRRVR